MKVKELIKTLCDFNPNADVEVLYNNEALLLMHDISWNCGDDDSPINYTNKGDVKTVHLYAIDEGQAMQHEAEIRKQFEEIAGTKPKIEGNTEIK